MTDKPEGDADSTESDSPSRSLDQVWDGVEAQYHEWEAQVREANDRIDQAAGRPLRAAILVGLVLGGIFLAALLLSPLLFGVFVAVLLVLAVWELVGAMRGSGTRLSRTVLAVVSVGILAAAYLYGGDGLFTGLFAAMLLVAVGRLGLAVVSKARTRIAQDIQRGWFVLFYLPFLASAAVALRQSDGGQWWILSAMIIVVTVDTSAYAVGRALGRHKLAPTISPGKTWEGLAGATLAGVVAGVLTGILVVDIGPWWGAVVGLATVASATAGDLLESLIKRDLGVKDMSSLLPGHGGLLDRLDSAMPSVALAYLLYQFLG